MKREMEYDESDYLMISGLQHFAFCRRQWALIHIENQWAENYRTTDGSIMHKKAHDYTFSEVRKDVIIKRGIKVASSGLGVSGDCDVVEFHRENSGIPLEGREGLWQPYPIEYKRGKPGITEGNALQLCCQSMCLEEMLCCSIPFGYIYYGETKHRERVEFTEDLREKVKKLLVEMHKYFIDGYTPKVKKHTGCRNCSLNDICLPQLSMKRNVSEYMKEAMEE